jgi:hypothetical protein
MKKKNIGNLPQMSTVSSNWQQNMMIRILKNSSVEFFNTLGRFSGQDSSDNRPIA